MADETHVELEHPDDKGNIVAYDDYDTTARQTYVEEMVRHGWKIVPKCRQEKTEEK
jgi:hypothetical protein